MMKTPNLDQWLKQAKTDAVEMHKLRCSFGSHATEIVGALKELVDLCKSFQDDLDCDHAVGICACGARRSIEDAMSLIITLEASCQK